MLEIKITDDRLSVYTRLSAKQADAGEEIIVTEDEVLSLLEKNGVKYGIMNDEIRDFCAQKNYYQWKKVALGVRAIDGEDGSFKLAFEPASKGPKERDDGSVDYRELGLVKNVIEGEVLCNITLPTSGDNGTNVFGGEIQARSGKAATVQAGNGVVLTDDGTELRAETDGCVYFKGGKVLIEEVYTIKEDVSLKTGNVQFNGSIHINGSVLEGFKVSAKKDIYVKGLVEGAELFAEGNIVIVGGVTGMNTAKIEAVGDIAVKFIENATVTCGGNLTCDIILMSDVKVEKSIFMKGERAAIIGGKTLAGEKINARTLGSDRYPQQEVSVRKNWRIKGETDTREKEKENIAALKKKLHMAEEYFEKFDAKIKEENALGPNKNIASLKEYMVKKSEFSSVIASIKKVLDAYKEEDFTTSITCTGFIYPGVKLNIDSCYMVVSTESQNQKFFVNNGEIVIGAVLPGDSTA